MMKQMVRTLHRICICLSLLITVVICGQQDMQLTLRMQGAETGQKPTVTVDRPFRVEVTVNGQYDGAELPQFVKSKRYTVRRVGTSMTLINGIKSFRYTYAVVVNKVGIHKLGPAMIGSTKSNILTVHAVKKDEQQTIHKHAGASEKKSFVALRVEPQEVVLGESVRCALHFYKANKRISLQGISQLDIPNCDQSEVVGPTTSQELVNGVEYDVVTLRWSIVPHKTGVMTIPAYTAEYLMPDRRRSLFGGFGALLGIGTVRERIQSESVEITVKPLPEHQGSVHGVGRFKSVTAHLDQSVIKQGEAALLTITLIGKDANKQVKLHDVCGVADGFKCYESDMHVSELQQGLHKQERIFILQGVNTGSWEIPAQEFTFFDTDERAYKTLSTVPLLLDVLPGKKQVTTHKERVADKRQGKKGEKVQSDEQQVLFVNSVGTYSVPDRSVMSLWLFVLLCAMPLIGAVVIRNHVTWRGMSKFARVGHMRYSAVSRARRTLQKAEQASDYAALFPLFKRLLGERCRVLPHTIDMRCMRKMLRDRGATEDEGEQFIRFMESCSAYLFSDAVSDDPALFKQAYTWLDRLKELL